MSDPHRQPAPTWLAPPADRASRVCVKRLLARGGAPGPAAPRAARAAQYLRMSTDRQDCSPLVQAEAIAAYAAREGMELVRTYADEGISGLTLRQRPGLRALLADVADGAADYTVVLAYDVSRWGRFQDCDESAHYEFLCRRAGVRVEYCAEPFRNDGTPYATVMKSLKRIMAGEYSRDLSQKVFRAKAWRIARGQRQGGAAGFGYRRLLLSAAGEPLRVLESGESKYLSSDLVTLVPGPRRELRVVRWIFRQAADGLRMPTEIARTLNRRGVRGPYAVPWNRGHVLAMLSNEKYAGHLVFNRRSGKLKTRVVDNPRELWVRAEGAHPAIVDADLFRRAQEAVARWSTRIGDEQAISALRGLLAREGRLSERLIDACPGIPGTHFYANRFGSLTRAYRLAGFEPARDYSYVAGYRARRRRAAVLRSEVAALLSARGLPPAADGAAAMVVGGGVRVAVMVAVRLPGPPPERWGVQPRTPYDWLLAERTSPGGGPPDFWLVGAGGGSVRLGGPHRGTRPRHRSERLEPLLDLLAAACAGSGRRDER